MNTGIRKNKTKKIRRIILFTVLIILIIMLIFLFTKKENNLVSNKYEALNTVQLDRFRVVEYFIYGTHLTIRGNLPLNDVSNIKEVSMVLVNKDDNKENIELETEYIVNESVISFNTKELVNDSIYLDNLSIGEYYLMLKVDSNYYTGLNNTEYNNLTYYTLTSNDSNNKIDISFGYKDEIPYIEFSIKETKLPNDVYDIVIDPGHGGKDPGNTSQSVPEKEQVLEISKKIKTKLEALGYKVLLTRDSDINPGNIVFKREDGITSYIDPYGEGGRIGLSYESKAKYTFSIHTNAHPKADEYYGFEIYTPRDVNYDLARSLTDNIVELSEVNYSTNWYYRKSKGIYTRLLSKDDLANMKISADELGIEMYPSANSNTVYNYMIRETGGYMMGAYVDGRDPEKGTNPYINYNHATETYLIEFGYASSEIDYPKIVNNKDEMAEGFVKGFISYIENK